MSPRRGRVAAAACVAAAAAATGWVVLDGGSGGAEAQEQATAPGAATATVSRRDLVESETVDGTLGYAGSRTVANQLQGTLTRLPSEGSVVERGESLYEVDGRPSAYLMHGRRPAWRAFEPGMSDGEDVRQLEQNLAALGYAPGVVDDDFTDSTEAAIERWQRARGVRADGQLDFGEVVFLPDDARIESRKAATGMKLQPGQEVLETSSNRRVVTVQLPSSRRSLVSRGDQVEVELPDGKVVRGRISRISAVAKPAAEDGGEATVEVTVVLRGRAARGLDRAPVTVSITRAAARDVLSVPVTALLALEGGGTAVEVVDRDGTRRTVRVRTGKFADGYVEISGRGIREGARVVVPDAL